MTAGRDGLRLFNGGLPVLVSRAVEPTWRAADWLYGERAIVVLDPGKEIVRVALPSTALAVGAKPGCDTFLTCDFKGGWDDGTTEGGGSKWSVDTFSGSGTARVLAGALVVTGLGTHAPVFSVVGETVENTIADSSDFAAGFWTFVGVTPTVTASQPDGRRGNYATKWAYASLPASAEYALPTATVGRSRTTISFRIKPSIDVPITVSLAGAAPTLSQTVAAGIWTRIVARFGSAPAAGATITIGFGGVAAADILMADFQVAFHTEQADWGFSDTAAGSTGLNACALLVVPTASEIRDFAGRIRMLYETGLMGERVGRSRFDRCLVRAVGDGYVAAKYKGLGTREWTMVPVQATTVADEDLEYGADIQAPLASLEISTTSENGWVSVRGLTVFSSPLGVGRLRGTN